MNFADKLKAIRKEKGLTQNELAIKAGISLSSIINYENRRRKNPPYTIVQRIAAALDVPLDSLIEVEYTEDGSRIPPTEEERELERMDAELAHDVLTGKTSPEDARILKPYRHLNNEGRDKVVAYASDLEGNPKYQRIQ